MRAQGIRILPGIVWVEDRSQTIIVNENAVSSRVLTGYEGALWTWLTQRYPYTRLLRFSRLALHCTATKAQEQLLCTLQEWQRLGLVELEVSNG